MNMPANSDLSFLTGGLPEKKVSREVAMSDFKRFLEERSLVKKTLRKAEEDEEGMANFESAKEIVVNCIMDGTIVVTDEMPCSLVHTLTVPPKDTSGKVLIEELKYGFVPDVAALRKCDNFKENQTMGKVQALLSAMTNRSVNELGKISSMDLDIIAAVAFFLV